MTAIAAFLRKTPVIRLQDYFTAGRFTSLAPIDWTKPEPEVVEPLVKAVDAMSDDEKQQVIINAGQVAALADEPGQNALQNVVINRAVFDTLEGANNRSLWVFLNEPDQFRKAEEVRYNDERRRGRSWSGFEVEKDCTVRRDPVSVAAFTKAIRDRFETPHVHVDVFDRHRVILDDQECDLVQVAVYREGRPEDMLGFDANSTLSRRIVKPVFEAALTYEAATGVIEVVANTLEDRRDLTAYMARDLLGIDFEEKHIPFREYDLSMLLKPFDFPTDVEDGIKEVTVKELRFMDVGERNERITLESMSGAERSIWEMAEKRIGLHISGTGHVLPIASAVPEWIITRARFTIKFHPGPGGGRGKSLTLTVTMPHGCNLKDMTPHERLIGEKYLRRWGIGILEAAKTWHVLEFKTHGVKSFNELTAKGVVLAKPQHAAQMQIYMHLTGITRALYVAVCKDTDALHIERVEADSAMAERLLEKAGRIIFAQHPPERISEDPAWFECRFCDHHAACHGGVGAAVTCRSCLHATPVDGGWHCARHDRMLAPAAQRAACARHLFIPDLVPGEVIYADDDVVTYRMADGSIWANDARSMEAAPC